METTRSESLAATCVRLEMLAVDLEALAARAAPAQAETLQQPASSYLASMAPGSPPAHVSEGILDRIDAIATYLFDLSTQLHLSSEMTQSLPRDVCHEALNSSIEAAPARQKNPYNTSAAVHAPLVETSHVHISRTVLAPGSGTNSMHSSTAVLTTGAGKGRFNLEEAASHDRYNPTTSGPVKQCDEEQADEQPSRKEGQNTMASFAADKRGPILKSIQLRWQPIQGMGSAAFPFRRTVFFLKWDDTLCPTSWIRSILTAKLSEYKAPQIVLTVKILREAHDLHVSCTNLAGDEVLAENFNTDDSIAKLQYSLFCHLMWTSAAFLNEGEHVHENLQLKDYSLLIAKGTKVEDVNREVEWRDSIPRWADQPLPDDPCVNDLLARWQQTVIDVITAMQFYGIVCIVTNAVPGWVERSLHKWMPCLKGLIAGVSLRPHIDVLYGQEAHRSHAAVEHPGRLKSLGLPLLWQKAAMTKALDDVDWHYERLPTFKRQDVEVPVPWWDNGDHKRLVNVIYVGDVLGAHAANLAAWSFAEQRLQQVVRHDFSDGCSYAWHWPWVKLIERRDCPHVKQLIAQMHQIRTVLPVMVARRQHCRISAWRLAGDAREELFEPAGPDGVGNRASLCARLFGTSFSTEDEKLERSLLIQTV